MPSSNKEQQQDSSKYEGREQDLKILGLSWDVIKDEFRFDFTELIAYVKSLPPTKRSLLKASAKLFDPLGLISPFGSTVST